MNSKASQKVRNRTQGKQSAANDRVKGGGNRLVEVPSDTWWFVQFIDPQENKWLGNAFIQARSLVDCGSVCWRLGINPGGKFYATTLCQHELAVVPESLRNKLLTLDDLKAFQTGAALETCTGTTCPAQDGVVPITANVATPILPAATAVV